MIFINVFQLTTLQANNVDGHVELGRIFVLNNDLVEANKVFPDNLEI